MQNNQFQQQSSQQSQSQLQHWEQRRQSPPPPQRLQLNFSPVMAMSTERRYRHEIEAAVGVNHSNSLMMLAAVASEVRTRIRGKRRIEDVEGEVDDNENVENDSVQNPQLPYPRRHYPEPQIPQLQYRLQIPQQNVVDYWVSKFLAVSTEQVVDTKSDLSRWVKRRRIEDAGGGEDDEECDGPGRNRMSNDCICNSPTDNPCRNYCSMSFKNYSRKDSPGSSARGSNSVILVTK
ncbi:hypothetical protein Glove_87g110 [Diversispora epigaea]|uniref:Uncharacterized protein n=1 Tax=Diversispora epigaea TaxID=1348612 RepID=A0A397J8D4_9GLOM|nr:hypothetical protein Glove_87g110 [Diversispora epigaea]